MAHKEKIDYLLLDIQELGQKVADMREAEIYPVSFFSRSFELAHKILTDLHKLEADQLKELSLQMEEHRSRLSAMPAEKDIPEEKAVPAEKIMPAEKAATLSDFRKAFSLNDRFRFRRELFGGDEDRMNKTISELNELHSYEDSVSFLHDRLQWNPEDEVVADFLKFIEKRFM